MEIKFADSFHKSLKRLIWHQHPVYKFYEFFRHNLPKFLENLWFFRKQLWEFRSWDYSFNLQFFARTLEKTVKTIEFNGFEVDITRLKKVEKMKRVIQLIDNIRTDSYIEVAEKKLGELKHFDWNFEPAQDNPDLYQLIDTNNKEENEHNRKIYKLADEIEAEEWSELFTILKGQDIEEYRNLFNSLTDDKKKGNLWLEWYDGSGMKHWWD
jgi:hypothetical protein